MTALTAPGIAARRRPGLTLALLAFAQLIVSIDYNIVYVAPPEIGSDLGFSAQSLQWVISAYAVAFGGFLLLAGGGAAIVAVANSGLSAAPSPTAVTGGLQTTIAVAGIALTALVALRLRGPR
ncbi:hypothetical protein [Streptosporangium jomthongense]|uniref:MFS transporter n=1 Tax=Streptosporangium jomthongense TaxID=1193683 RepID=A0ABV8F178_9ACTN